MANKKKGEKDFKTQEELVLDYLRRHKDGLTSRVAVDLLGIMQLPARVMRLRDMGHNIVSVPMHGTNRFGKTVYFVKYVLEE